MLLSSGKFPEPGSFLSIPGGQVVSGISYGDADRLHDLLHGSGVKNEYILNSCPRSNSIIGQFLISVVPVSASDFGFFTGQTGYKTEAEIEGWGWTWDGMWKKTEGVSWKRPFGPESDNSLAGGSAGFPALQVSWNDALAFCAWLSEYTGIYFHIPSEKEYDAFYREISYPEIMDAAGGIHQGCSLSALEYAETLAGLRGPSPYYSCGLTWEWAGDWFDAYPGGPVNREFGSTYKVLRGGSLLSHPVQRTREYRFRRCPTARSPFYSFRVASHFIA